MNVKHIECIFKDTVCSCCCSCFFLSNTIIVSGEKIDIINMLILTNIKLSKSLCKIAHNIKMGGGGGG